MVGIDIEAELREYQWRRRFERERRHGVRSGLLFATVLVILVVIGRAVIS
jgi:hypothetical protein